VAGERLPGLCLASFLLACPLAAAAQEAGSQPEEASGRSAKTLVTAKRYMIAAAHPLAARAGLEVLDRGGSAIDAMVATQLVLGLVEPQSSGLGVHAARAGGWSVGVPGVPRLLEAAHARWGKLPWASLFGPAIDLAEQGFLSTARLARLSAGDGIGLEPAARAYLLADDGRPKPAGTRLRNPEYARTLRAMAARGAEAFYTGDIARDIVAAVQGHRNAGTLSMEDLAGYRVRESETVCAPYRAYRLCGVGPSTYGGIAVLQVMGALARFDMARVRPNSSEAVHLVTEAERLAYADRGRYGADERFADVPVQALIAPGYVAARSALIDARKSMARAQAGEPRGVKTAYADDPAAEASGTTHLAIVDADGNAVSLSSSVEGDFGTRIMARGFFLNNTLTDFSFLPVEDGKPVANGVAPGKRPRSSMAPIVAFDARSGALEMVVGSPGGSLIIGYVAKTLLATLDWGMDMQAAIDLPNFVSRNGPTEIEKGTELEGARAALNAMGHDVKAIDMTSGLHGIRRGARGWQAGADPRREGIALGR
jgi:gamma-glutamyltranspeptidase/glutathione hydrolase